MRVGAFPRAARVAVLAVAGLLGVAWTAADASVPLDLDGSVTRCRAMARTLLSADPARWREAQLRLATAGPSALVALDDEPLVATELGRQRIEEVLRLGLLLSMDLRDLDEHPRLRSVVEDRIAWGRILAQALARRPRFSSDDTLLVPIPQWRRGLGPLQDVGELTRLEGLALPAAFAMLRDEHAVARVYACVLLRDLGARVPADSLAPLYADSRKVDIQAGDVIGSSTTVARTAHDNTAVLVANGDDGVGFWTPLRLLEKREGQTWLLESALRKGTDAHDPKTWDEWWDEARRLWTDWWQAAGGTTPPARVWDDLLNEYEGYRLSRSWTEGGARRLRVTGPPRTTCTLVREDSVVARGTVPFQWRGRKPADCCDLYAVEAAGAEGRTWKVRLPNDAPGLGWAPVWTVTLLREAKKAEPAPRVEGLP